MPRLLLILPTATYRAAAFLSAAERLQAEVVTASERPQALASAMGDRFLEIPLDDPTEAARRIAMLAARSPVDAVVAVDDQGVLAAALACERLGLRHSPPAAVAATRDKAMMRERLAAAGVPQPAYRAVAGGPVTAEIVAAAVSAAGDVGWPVVVKPTGLSASRGVIRADDEAGAAAAARRVLGLLERLGEKPNLLVERYLPGAEVAVEAIASGGELVPLAVFDKPDPLVGPYFEETIYVTPSRHAPAVQAAVLAAVGRAAGALGLTEGPLHGEVRIVAGGEAPVVAVLELAARTIGGRCAAALRFAAGDTSLEEVVLAHALGRQVPTGLAAGASGVMMLPIPRSGRLVEVGGLERAQHVAGVSGVEITVPPGRRVEALPEGDRYLGFVFARAATPEQVETALRDAHAELDVRIAEHVVRAVAAVAGGGR